MAYDIQTCRDKFGKIEVSAFQRRSCALCFQFLFPSNAALKLHSSLEFLQFPINSSLFNIDSNNTNSSQGVNSSNNTDDNNAIDYLFNHKKLIIADPNNKLSSSLICSVINNEECQQWKDCCLAASFCCKKQLTLYEKLNLHCPATWDGFGCWNHSPAASVSRILCPKFVPHVIQTS